MNKRSVSLWGFVGTVILTTLMAGSQRLGLSRINFPFMLGTMFTPNRDRAKLIGFGVHFLNGWIFASVYAAAFERPGACALRAGRRPASIARDAPADGE
jgi:hypothetical protein